jgi:hypothetical protein
VTHLPPCADRTNDPQDWFIRSDGRQYSDEDLLTPQEVQSITLTVLSKSGETVEEHAARVQSALSAARGNRKRAALARRRRAKSLCFSDCAIRLQCLDGALARREGHGTWGGYLEEELHEIRREQARRNRRRVLAIITP